MTCVYDYKYSANLSKFLANSRKFFIIKLTQFDLVKPYKKFIDILKNTLKIIILIF
jgi:hypothetical protein